MELNTKADSPGVLFLPPLAFVTCLLAGITCDAFWPYSIAWLPAVWRIVLGVLIGGGGFYILSKGFRLFMQAETDPLTTRPASSLVTTGIYTRTRNPMYIGEIAFLAGIGIVSNSYWIVLSSIVFGLYLHCYVIQREEAYLLRRFGDRYAAYCGRVHRWWAFSFFSK